ncbi:HAD family hydrolase, partial [Candidatus Zixiibacteriota bacterium]
MTDRPRTKLVLFDIDGTLLYTGGAGRRAMRQSLQEIFGSTGPIKNFSFCGKTDPQIILELMTLAGYASSYIEKRMARFWDCYIDHLRVEMAQNDKLMVYPGVVRLVKELYE